MQLRKETYSRLTPTQRLQVARHPNRPTCLDIILNITDKFVELHGDRAGLDDPAIVCGIGSMDGVSFMFIGQQKGRNTKVRGGKATQRRAGAFAWGGTESSGHGMVAGIGVPVASR
jgi:acetyl-CoA carboxylase alpha subunit